ncbi:MAG: SIMPL domain-containing protein [Candidatus Micrarchaeota archaeon]
MKECEIGGCGTMIVLASLLIALGMVGGGYMLAQGDYAPRVDMSHLNNTPNIYMTTVPPDHDISVSASATKEVAPDLLEIRISITTIDDNASESQSRNAEVTNELLAKLENLGINDSDIKTTSYSVDPDYESDYVCNSQGKACHWEYELTGYETTHMLLIDVEELDKGGSVIDAAAATGVNETFVDSISYTLKPSTRSEMTKTLLKEAAAAAKAEAEKIAEGLGITLGDVLSASESSYVNPYYYNSYKTLSYAEDAVGAAPTTLSPGEVSMSLSVSVSYEVGN